MQILTIDVFVLRFRVSTHTTLFYPDKKESLYKVVVIDHQSNKTQIRYKDWGSNCDKLVCCRSICAYSQFSSQLSTSNEIPHDITAKELPKVTLLKTANLDLNALRP